jgi:hypothetical protein
MSTITPSAIQNAVINAESVRRFQKILDSAYLEQRKKLGMTSKYKLTLSFTDDVKKNSPDIARYLYNRAFGGPGWNGSPDKVMAMALESILTVKVPQSTIIPVHTTVDKSIFSKQSSRIRSSRSPHPKIKSTDRSLSRSRSQSPGRSHGLSGFERLLLGVTQPERENETTVSAFLDAVRTAKEPGSTAIQNISTSTGMQRGQLNFLARRFLYPPAEILQLRVNDIVKRSSDLKVEITKVLAADIRAVQEENQQVIHANQQLSRSLLDAVHDMKIEGEERKRIESTVKQLDATRGMAIREINKALNIANDALIESGAAGPSTVSKNLVNK